MAARGNTLFMISQPKITADSLLFGADRTHIYIKHISQGKVILTIRPSVFDIPEEGTGTAIKEDITAETYDAGDLKSMGIDGAEGMVSAQATIKYKVIDVYTGNDTHVYNMSDILTNDTKPSGVALPSDAYGIVAVTVVTGVGGMTDQNSVLIGNFRILDNLGYEYRTNSLGIRNILTSPFPTPNFYFNYNVKGNVTLSDVVGIALNQNQSGGEIVVSPQETWAEFDIDIYNTNEVPFSCRDIIFACIDDDNPVLEQLLENVGGASVASFEYGINNAIPHSKGGELLCPGNNISDGVVVLRPESTEFDEFIGYIGLNNGNGRGSMDSFWNDSFFISNQGLEVELP